MRWWMWRQKVKWGVQEESTCEEVGLDSLGWDKSVNDEDDEEYSRLDRDRRQKSEGRSG